MERKALQELLEWKNRPDRQPLIIMGARQTGKTWLMKEFGARNFKRTAYIPLDSSRNSKTIFDYSLRPKDIIPLLSAEAGTEINKDTLLIFDEIQAVPNALHSLKYFCEEAPEISIMAAGSTLGLSLHEGISFPVGKTEFYRLRPMDFLEFLSANSEDGIKNILESRNFSILNAMHEKIMALLRQYMLIGGMPEAVSKFLQTKDFKQARKIQKKILLAYQNDFAKHASGETAKKISLLWKSLPGQLAKENKKFIYGAVRPGARARDFETALQWLEDSSIIHKLHRAKMPMLPLKAYEDFNAFKVFIFDIGLLCAMSGLDERIILDGDSIFREFKGALAEQLVMQELVSAGISPFYWTADNSQAEVDFLIQHKNQIIPVEAKSGTNLQAKSLKSYIKRFSPQTAIRASALPYKQDGTITDLPLYAAGLYFSN